MNFILIQQQGELKAIAKQFEVLLTSITKEKNNNYNNLLYKFNINYIRNKQKGDEIIANKQLDIQRYLQEMRRMYEETLNYIIESIKINMALLNEKSNKLMNISMPENKNVDDEIIEQIGQNYIAATTAAIAEAQEKMAQNLRDAEQAILSLNEKYPQTEEYQSRTNNRLVHDNRVVMNGLVHNQHKIINDLKHYILYINKECLDRLDAAIQDQKFENRTKMLEALAICLEMVEDEHYHQTMFQQKILDVLNAQKAKSKATIAELKATQAFLIESEKINIT